MEPSFFSKCSTNYSEKDMKKLWIRPVHDKKTDRLISMAVCTTKYGVLVDEQILEHFSLQMSGKDVRECYPEHTMVWGPQVLVIT